MGDPTAFKHIRRAVPESQPVSQRLGHWREFIPILPAEQCEAQAARCMDCGIPFCESGCPTHNLIPDWNDLVYRRYWRQAVEFLHSTNNFPEFTGRICPAPCEQACTLELARAPVSVKAIENAIIEHAWRRGWVRPEPSKHRTGKRIAIVGSGPAGLACAQQLARAGHAVQVMEKHDRIGGLLRYGIPDFKLEKWLLDRRLAQMRAEGVVFCTGMHVGIHVASIDMLRDFDAVVLACGAEQPRDLDVPGRELAGIHFAMDFLVQQNRRIAGDAIDASAAITATDKDVVIIGGGDTGSDCIGTANRQGARSVTQIQYHEMPPLEADPLSHWPQKSPRLRTSESHVEGCRRLWGLNTIAFHGMGGHVAGVEVERIDWQRRPDGGWDKLPVPNSRRLLDCQLALLAMGYAHPVHAGPMSELGLTRDRHGNAAAVDFRTNIDKVFACGDMRMGQSLVVWAIREGRGAARAVDEYLMGSSELPD